MRKNILLTLLITLIAAISFCGGWWAATPEAEDTEETKQLSRQDINDSIMDARYPEYRVYGMREEKDRQRQIVDHQYKFRFRIAGGCVVDYKMVAEVDRKNAKTDKIMTKRYGKDWYAKFEKSVDSLYALDSTAIAIARQHPAVTRFDSLVNIHTISHPTHDLNKKVVTVDDFESQLLSVKVDLKTKKIISIDTTAFKY